MSTVMTLNYQSVLQYKLILTICCITAHYVTPNLIEPDAGSLCNASVNVSFLTLLLLLNLFLFFCVYEYLRKSLGCQIVKTLSTVDSLIKSFLFSNRLKTKVSKSPVNIKVNVPVINGSYNNSALMKVVINVNV